MGKYISFSLAFPGAKFCIGELAQAVRRASSKKDIQLTAGLREEVKFWRFLDEWDRNIPWKDEKHWVLSVSTDASCHAGPALFIIDLMTWCLRTSSNQI